MGVGKLPGGGSEGGWPSSPNSRKQPSEIISKSMTQGGGVGSEGGYGLVPSPQYHNPDLLVHLIGPANESPVEVKGVKITSLIDSGACMSAMVKSFAEELNLEVKTSLYHTGYREYWRGEGAIPWLCRMLSKITANQKI